LAAPSTVTFGSTVHRLRLSHNQPTSEGFGFFLKKRGIVMTTEIPPGLHELEYARYILEEVLAWPAKSNLEMMADCLRSIGKSKKLKPEQACWYMLRAIKLAREQGLTLDRLFFLDGRYTAVRPEQSGIPLYKPIDKEALAREQATPEWQALNAQLRATLAKIAGKTTAP
jgi:hypothetical protein